MVNGIIELDKKITIGKLIADDDDGAYDGNNIFRYLAADDGIQPCIKVRKNAKVGWKKGKNILRNLTVLALRNDLQKWKDSISYGQRWIIETVFSSIERMFVESMFIQLN